MSRRDLYTVPSDSTHLTIWTRASFPAPRTPDFCGERGLSIDGHKLCRDVGRDYAYIQKKMCPALGPPIFFSASDLISQSTCSEIFMPEAIRPATALDEDVNLMRLADGVWYDKLRAEGLAFTDACEAAWQDQDAVLPDLNAQLNTVEDFFFDSEILAQTNLRICVSPESLISMFVARHDKPDIEGDPTHDFIRLGLYSCQSFFFYHNTYSIQAILRLDPRASVEAMLKRHNAGQARRAATG